MLLTNQYAEQKNVIVAPTATPPRISRDPAFVGDYQSGARSSAVLQIGNASALKFLTPTLNAETAVGFGDVVTGYNIASAEFAIVCNSAGQFAVYENGSIQTAQTARAANDEFEITLELVNNLYQVKYWRTPNAGTRTLIHTSTKTDAFIRSKFPIYADFAFKNAGGIIENVRFDNSQVPVASVDNTKGNRAVFAFGRAAARTVKTCSSTNADDDFQLGTKSNPFFYDPLPIALEADAPSNGIAGNFRRYAVKVSSGNEILPIKSFNFNAPGGSIGESLDVTFAKVDYQIDANKKYKFEIGAIQNDLSTVYKTLIESAVFQGKQNSIALQNNAPTDAQSLSLQSEPARKFSLAPPRPQVYFDRAKVSIDATTANANAITREDGTPILTEYIGTDNLTLYKVLRRVYVRELGFSQVLTNLPDYLLSRLDVSIESGFHSSVSSAVGMFDTAFFVVGTVLWILDKNAPLPVDFIPREIAANKYKVLSRVKPPPANVDALLLTVSDLTQSEFFTTRTEQESQDNGTFGEADYTRTDTTRKIREFKDAANPTVILREFVQETITSTFNAALELTGRETVNNFVDAFGKQTRVTRKVEALTPALPSGTMQLQTCREESCLYSYAQNPFKPAEQILTRSRQTVTGLIYVDAANPYLEQPFKSDFLDSHRAGNIDLSQSTMFGLIAVNLETFKPLSEQQTEVTTRKSDVLRNTVISETVTRSGNTGYSIYNAAQKRILIYSASANAAGNKSKQIQSFGTGELTRAQAVSLAKTKLEKLINPNETLTLELPVIDFQIRRGTVLKVLDRANAVYGNFLVLGYSIKGESLGTPNQLLTMSLQLEKIS